MNDMNINHFDLNLLVVFDAVARTRSVSRAAEELSLSQPAVSHALRRLREAMSDPLFVRGRSALTLTPRAKEVARPIANILTEARRVFARSQFDCASLARRFRIGASDYAMMALVPGVARALRDSAPDSDIEVAPVGTDTFDRLEAGDLDLVFWGAAPPRGPFVADELFRESFVGLIGARHPLAKAAGSGSIDLDQFLAYPHIVASFPGSSRSPVDKALADLGRARRIGLSTPSFAASVAALRDSDLVMSAPSRLVPALAVSDVVEFVLPLSVPRHPYWLVRHRAGEADTSARWFRELVKRATAP